MRKQILGGVYMIIDLDATRVYRRGCIQDLGQMV
jgi:hypothetical protein